MEAVEGGRVKLGIVEQEYGWECLRTTTKQRSRGWWFKGVLIFGI